MDIKKFEVDKKYFARSICDSNCIFKFEILGRSEKTVTVREINCNQKARRKKIYLDDHGQEYCLPFGDYSMAPILRANRELIER